MKLFEPVAINSMTLPNRIVLPVMVTRLSGEDGYVNQDVRDRYLRFAHGEPGLIVVEAMSVHGGRSGPLLRMSDDSFIAGQAEMVRAIRVAVSPGFVSFGAAEATGSGAVAGAGPDEETAGAAGVVWAGTAAVLRAGRPCFRRSRRAWIRLICSSMAGRIPLVRTLPGPRRKPASPFVSSPPHLSIEAT